MGPTGSSDNNTVVRTWCVPGAPTGESERFLTQDGRVWKRDWTPEFEPDGGLPTGVEKRRLRLP